MLENRQSTRQLTLRTGRITAVDAPNQIDCAILNLSRSGACILVPDGCEVVELFELVIDREHGHRNCRLIWRNGSRIGVEFIDEHSRLDA